MRPSEDIPWCSRKMNDKPFQSSRENPSMTKGRLDAAQILGDRALQQRDKRGGFGVGQVRFIPAIPPLRNRKFADSPLEGNGFEPSVPDRCRRGLPPETQMGPH